MILSIVSFVVAFGLLVLVHEFGHFWVARRSGVAVEKFSIGFGPKIFGFTSKGTLFQISLLPLGGFVKMKGEEAEDEKNIDPDDTTAFSNKSALTRSGIVLAGPMMNLILSFILMPLVFWIGKPEPAFLAERPVIERLLPNSSAEKAGLQMGDQVLSLNGKTVATWEETLQTLSILPAGKKLSVGVARGGASKTFALEMQTVPGAEGAYAGFEKFFGRSPSTIVKEVDPNGSAAKSGIERGDKIEKIEGKTVQDWDDLVRRIQSYPHQTLSMEVVREGKTFAVAVQPQWDAKSGRYLIGIQGSEAEMPLILATRRYAFTEAVAVGWKTNWKNVVLTFEVLKKLVTAEISYKMLGGPVRIAYTLAKASASGLADFLYFTAFLSLQLAVLNILPIPVLDGGHIVFYLIEAIRKKPLSLKTRMVAQQAGMVLLLTLIVFVTWNDLQKLFF